MQYIHIFMYYKCIQFIILFLSNKFTQVCWLSLLYSATVVAVVDVVDVATKKFSKSHFNRLIFKNYKWQANLTFCYNVINKKHTPVTKKKIEVFALNFHQIVLLSLDQTICVIHLRYTYIWTYLLFQKVNNKNNSSTISMWLKFCISF